jgi:outer membrane usher protein
MAASARLTDRISYFLSGGLLKQSTGLSKEIFSGLTFLFGETTAALSYQKYTGTNTGLMTVQKSLPVGTGFGYRFQAAPGGGAGIPTVDSLLQYQGQYGRYEVNYTRLDSQNSTLLNMAGGVAMIGGDYFLTRPVQDSFAVIDVAGIGGVRGYSNNQEMGRSSGNGNLFIPNLLPYYGNKLAIADLDIPMNYMVDKTEKVIAPPYRGGAVVKFPVQRIQRISGEIELDDGRTATIPAFGQVLIKARNRVFESPVGRKGEFYFENLPPGQHIAALEYQDRQCDFRIDVPKLDQDEIKVGKLVCRLN